MKTCFLALQGFFILVSRFPSYGRGRVTEKTYISANLMPVFMAASPPRGRYLAKVANEGGAVAGFGHCKNRLPHHKHLMKKINTAVLQRGDIVLTTAEAWESTLIRTVTHSDISHAMICVSNSSVMDSTGEGVHARNPQKMFYPDSCAIHVMRLRACPGQQVIDRAIEYVRTSTATSYDVSEAVKSVFPMSMQGNTRQFCSRLVARAYAHVGVQLVANPDYCTPQELKASARLEPVADCTIYVSDADAATVIEQVGDATIDMRTVTMNFIQGVREFDPKSESLNDAIRLAIEKPELDGKIARKLLESGYLDYWRVESTKYPWRYDITEMVRLQNAYLDSGEPIVDMLSGYCEDTLAHDQQGDFHHWQDSLKQLNAMCLYHPRETLEHLRKLYGNLVMQHGRRVQTAKIWLRWRNSISA